MGIYSKNNISVDYRLLKSILNRKKDLTKSSTKVTVITNNVYVCIIMLLRLCNHYILKRIKK